MSGGILKVSPPVLQSAATSFDQAADGLGSLQAAVSLGAAAAAAPSLQIAAASLAAQSDVASETAALADGARQFSGNLQTAARWYEKRDQAAAEAIKKIGPASCSWPLGMGALGVNVIGYVCQRRSSSATLQYARRRVDHSPLEALMHACEGRRHLEALPESAIRRSHGP
jgi:hypothetical protein